MQVTSGRILSLLCAAGYVIFATESQGIQGLKCLLAVVMPLLLIWFPDELGSATNYFAGHSFRVNAETPPILISIMGWLFLIGLPLLLYFLWK